MKKTILLIAISIVTTNVILSQSKKNQDRTAIKEMSGCFEVTFNFSETFNYSTDTNYTPSKTKTNKGLEWAQIIIDENNKISIQHLLQVGTPAKPYIVKHWRQDWIYQNQDFYTYAGNNSWSFNKKPKKEVRKQWTQKVYQVDDSPRYEGSATWVHVDGKSYWENTTNAPLPRREYTKRSDFIQKYIFPGGMLPSDKEFKETVQKNNLKVVNEFDFGLDYSLTLQKWLKTFDEKVEEVISLGFNERFIKLWRYYLCYCISGFESKRTSVKQYTISHID